MSRDEQTKEKTSSETISVPPVVQPPAPVQTASLLDIGFDNQPQQQQQPPQAAAVQSSPWGGQQSAPQQQAQPSWDPFSNTGKLSGHWLYHCGNYDFKVHNNPYNNPTQRQLKAHGKLQQHHHHQHRA